MKPAWTKLRTWLRRTRSAYQQVQAEGTRETLRRFRWVALSVVPIDLVLVWWFWRESGRLTVPNEVAWAVQLAWSNLVMVVLGVVLALLAELLLRRGRHATLALQVLLCLVYLAFTAACSLIDQQVTPSIITFVVGCMGTAVLSLMRPALALPIYGMALLAFYGLLPQFQADPLPLYSNRIQAVVAVALSILVSWVVWHQYVQAVLLRRQLTASHTALTVKQKELEFLADHDALTGLYNRREFMRRAAQELGRSQRHPAATHVVLVDLDHFKLVNDEHGHPAGDAVLQHTASLLQHGVRSTDLVGRLGGEEFILLLPQTGRDEALAVAEKLRALLAAQPVLWGSVQLQIYASFGVSGLAPGEQCEIDELYRAADAALYLAKHLGRNRVEYGEPQSRASAVSARAPATPPAAPPA